MKRVLGDEGIKNALGAIINKIFFKGGLKLKDNPETPKNARNLSSLLAYIQKNIKVNNLGTITWFLSLTPCEDCCTESLKQVFKNTQSTLKTINKKIKFKKDRADIKNIVNVIEKAMDTIQKEDDTKELYITEIPGIINLWRAKVQNIDVVALEKEVEQIVDIKKKIDEAKSMEDNAILKKKITELGASSAIQNYMSATTADKKQELMIKVFDNINTVLKSTRRTHINPFTAFLLVRMKSVAWFCFSIAAGLYLDDVGIDDKDDILILDDLKKNFTTVTDPITKKESIVFECKKGKCNTSTMTLESLENIKKHYTFLKLGFRAAEVDLDSGGGAFRKEDKCLSWTKKFVQGVYNQCKKFAKK